ncbi:hypothetical protein N866_03850 [Actinotalea ferrariae CF5-4]|uniref:Transposase n=1 Tax=Actinotalea ferrariae CF5-4 TaxID=948458 RepID=A0A021VV96_9CELL|nr:hypothetical protein [Actinotalea ferrariae]EYR62987.1 hypothetical protein N866_03850 [Actinotalea ferrariae CF5-4]
MKLDNEFRRALEVVRRSGLGPELEQRLRPGRSGAPRQLSVEALLAACIVVHGRLFRTATFLEIHNLLTDYLGSSTQYAIGTRWTARNVTRTVTYRQIRYLFHRIADLYDYSPHTARTTRPNGSTIDPNNSTPLSAEERAARERDFITAMNRLIAASRPLDVPAASTLALDASGFATAARPVNSLPSSKHEADYQPDTSAFARQTSRSHDPDGRWDYCTRTHQKGSRRVFGYQIIGGVGVHAPEGPFGGLHLFQAFALVPGGYMKAAPTVRLLDAYQEIGNPTPRLVVDRGFSRWTTETWADELRARGIEQVFDLHPQDRGARKDLATGVLMIDGWPYAPWTPKRLHNIPVPAKLVVKPPRKRASEKKKAKYRRAIAALEDFLALQEELGQYALRPNTAMRPDGSRQFKQPTFNRHLATAAQRRTKVFQQATIVIPASLSSKLGQRERWGSYEWIITYALRSAVEGAFGRIQAKDSDGERVQRGWTRIVGLVPSALLLASVLVHHNLRIVRRWAKRTGFQSTDVLLAPDEDLMPELTVPGLLGSTAPPIAA